MPGTKRLRACATAVTLAFSSAQALAEPVSNWIGGSYVNVREAANRNAPVLDHLVINTPVALLAQLDEFCEISWGAQKKGYVACKLLRAKPTSLAEVVGQSAARTFWIEPTFEHLVGAAANFEAEMLPEKHKAREEQFLASGSWENPPALSRYAIPELEAMKSMLAQGVIAPRGLWRPAPAWENYPGLAGLDPLNQWLYRQIKLVAVKPSYFKSLNDVASPKATPETLSAQFSIRWKLKVDSASDWVGDSNSGPMRNGVWDIGKVTQRLEKPVYALVISDKGDAASLPSDAAFEDIANGDQAVCAGTHHILPLDSGQLPVLRTLLPLDIRKARITAKAQLLSPPKTGDGEPIYRRATATYIDLDRDGVNDIAVWDAINTQFGAGDGPEGSEYHAKFIFINVGGAWHLLEIDQDDPPCGC
ncbi:hypothetical protein [Pseudoduganella sp. R-34]|uniref:hypothetical protein n=1 Tax=Pseudoduganella sp. R-34 TaxID=3404062 RepID=UPI003CF2680B